MFNINSPGAQYLADLTEEEEEQGLELQLLTSYSRAAEYQVRDEDTWLLCPVV
jgi:hypothetical protein